MYTSLCNQEIHCFWTNIVDLAKINTLLQVRATICPLARGTNASTIKLFSSELLAKRLKQHMLLSLTGKNPRQDSYYLWVIQVVPLNMEEMCMHSNSQQPKTIKGNTPRVNCV